MTFFASPSLLFFSSLSLCLSATVFEARHAYASQGAASSGKEQSSPSPSLMLTPAELKAIGVAMNAPTAAAGTPPSGAGIPSSSAGISPLLKSPFAPGLHLQGILYFSPTQWSLCVNNQWISQEEVPSPSLLVRVEAKFIEIQWSEGDSVRRLHVGQTLLPPSASPSAPLSSPLPSELPVVSSPESQSLATSSKTSPH